MLRAIEKAKENFKDQTFDLKQEVKDLKKQVYERDENLHTFQKETKIAQKSMVLNDIKNLIKDYKVERKFGNK